MFLQFGFSFVVFNEKILLKNKEFVILLKVFWMDLHFRLLDQYFGFLYK
jgi:hypothetical protein